MNPGIFLIQDNEELIEMTEQTYESEKLLQTWLAQYPALLVVIRSMRKSRRGSC